MTKQQTTPCRRNQRGFSIVELMIAMLLGLLLMAGVLQLFSSNKTTFMGMEGIAEIQNGARAGIERMKSRIRMSGYMGCSNANVLNPNNITTGIAQTPFAPNVMVTGVDNDAAVNAVIDGTDSINVISASAANTRLNASMASRSSDLVIVSNPYNFRENDALVITDCDTADVFAISSMTGTGPFTIAHAVANTNGDVINGSTSLVKAYGANASLVMSLSSVTYSVQDTGRTDNAGNPVLGLFETPAGGAAVEVVSGVEDMQITYGIDASPTPNGEADSYQSAPAAGSPLWSRVVSVRIALRIATEREIGHEVRPYKNLTNTASPTGAVQAGDRHMRRNFVTTIGLRNRSS